MKKKKIIIFGVITLLAALYVFWESVNLNPLYLEGAVFWAVLFTVYVLAWALMRFGEVSFQFPKESGEKPFQYTANKKMPKWVKLLVIIPWAFIVVMLVWSSVIFNWKSYRDQFGTPESKKFTSDVQAIDVSQIPIVDKDLASKLADKKLGEKPSLGSQVVKGTPTIQMVDGKLVWAVPLYHSGFFKWVTNLEGSPGYIVVSATNVNDVTYVENHRIKYQPGAYLLQNLNRYVRFHGAIFTGITDFSFELDDSGVPYWVVSTYKNKVGFNLPEADGILTVNASTGEIKRYKMDSIPNWVDRVQPESFIINQINNRGEYVRGFLNFADTEKTKASEGHAIVYNNGTCYLFTGLTSVGSDESAIGFMMVNMVTKESFMYEMSGATELAAQGSAMGKVQHLGYTASFPIILNISNQPTYFMTLKDREGLVKQYAFVSVVNYSTVGTGETIQAAIKDYQNALKYDTSAEDFTTSDQVENVRGTVERIASEFNGTELIYKLILTEDKSKIYIITATASDELALTLPGDRVSLEAEVTDSPIRSATSFDNLQYTQK